jgi:alpha-L-fucosidase
MKIIIQFLFALSLLTTPVFAQTNYLLETKAEKEKRLQWWTDATFGMFIHWGLYAVPAGEYKGKGGGAEWIQETHRIPIPEYEQFAKQFNPVKFDATAWVKMAKDAGVKYIVITSKHHDGFSLWDSKVSEYDVMDATPFKRDIMKELSEACKAQGIIFCMYHSIMDWHHPDAKSKDYAHHQETENPNFDNYRENYLKPQLKELITKYDPAVLWFDGEWIPEWTEQQGKDLYNYLRNIKPSLVINNRVGKGRGGMQGMNKYENAAGDFGTPEQEILEVASTEYWESCMTLNESWGFSKEDQKWKSPQLLINNLTDIAAKGGNYLLNVGPTAEGLIPQQSVERLQEMGKWLKINNEAIYATKAITHFKESENVKFTQSKDNKYIYAIANEKIKNTLQLSTVKPKRGSKIYMLGTAEPLDWTKTGNVITITLPANLPSDYGFVAKIEGISTGEGFVEADSEPTLVKHNAIKASIAFVELPDDKYGFDKKGGLTDGILGSKNYDDGKWLSWSGKNLEAVVDFQKALSVSEVALHCLQKSKSWIVFPQTVSFWSSQDGTNWIPLTTIETEADPLNEEVLQKYFSYGLDKKQKFRYLKVRADCFGELPQGHAGAGKRPWIFADEIIVR